MSIKISFKKSKLERTSANLVLFVDERFNIRPVKRYISSLEYSYISDLLKSSDLKKRLLVFNLTSKKKIVLVSIKKNIKNSEIENLGAELYGIINLGKILNILLTQKIILTTTKILLVIFFMD